MRSTSGSSNFMRLPNYPAAFVEAQKLEAAIKTKFGTNHAGYAVALNSLASVYRMQGKYTEAEEFIRRALPIYERALGANHANVAAALIALANGMMTKANTPGRRGF